MQVSVMGVAGYWKVIAGCLVAAVLASGCATVFAPPPPPVTQEEIVEMTRAGAPDEKILERIRRTGTRYRLTAAEIVSLHNAGVSFTVLDYMMQTYIDKVREDQRYYDERYWWHYMNHYYWMPPAVIVVPHR